MSFQDTTPQENVTQAILPADRIVHVTFSEENASFPSPRCRCPTACRSSRTERGR
jgi:hypothetical protein